MILWWKNKIWFLYFLGCFEIIYFGNERLSVMILVDGNYFVFFFVDVMIIIIIIKIKKFYLVN